MSYTVEEAAHLLRLHPKTVLRYIREARLPATRVGKSYRIQAADVHALAGEAPPPALPERVTCVVDVPGASMQQHQSIATRLQAALRARGAGAAPVQLDLVYDPQQSLLKVLILARAGDAARLLGLLETLLQHPQP